MADDSFTDLVLARDADGVYDLQADPVTRDLATTGGFETALQCSLFTDRRALPDEVADPLKRRGWIGNLVAETPADNYGSGLWLYEQSRASQEVRAAIRMEVLQSLDWMLDQRLILGMNATVTYDPARRRAVISITATDKLGGVSVRSYNIWQRTGAGRIATNT